MRALKARNASSRREPRGAAGCVIAALFVAPLAFGQIPPELQRAADAARSLNYTGTIVYQHGNRIETSRLVHLADAGGDYAKLINLEGPAREVIRDNDQVRCYYPDVKLMRIEPRAFHNVFPALLPQQLATLSEYYTFRKAETARIAGLDAQAYIFEPKDNLRYAHKFWVDVGTGLLLKVLLLNERNDPVEHFAFSDIQIGVKLERDMLKPPFPAPPSDWQVRESPPGEVVTKETGWVVKDMPPGFAKIIEGYRTLRGKQGQVAHLVYSDGLVAVSVFIEPSPSAPQPVGMSQQGGINVYSRQLNDYLVTVLGEAPGTTVRQIAYSVGRR